MTRKMLTAAKSVVILPDVLYLYRQHEGSVTKRARRQRRDHGRDRRRADVVSGARSVRAVRKRARQALRGQRALCDASVRILKAQSAHPLLPQLLDFTAARFPDYRHNPYLKGYPARKKLVLSLLGKQQYRAVTCCLPPPDTDTMKHHNQLRSGSLLTYVQMTLNIIVSIAYTPFMLRILGKSEYGLYSTVASTIAILSVLSLGFGGSYVRYYILYRKGKGGRQDRAAPRRVFWCFFPFGVGAPGGGAGA